MQINCSSYDFWDMDEELHNFISNTFNSNNLGGWYLRIGIFDIIDKKFKEILT